ncbi:hypothetical protein [Mesobacillus subterraneus]|uniref:Lipoprotein n=1 Tax=Mesobacillus subterraneus TaxID=285983 RepID=A0A427TW66_9BACI|nr:hypothetical protein [Mesobacillus subterraneus]RSD28703.1 hypothetical protein EJA10_03775 [Mesobacillus subterraneus]
MIKKFLFLILFIGGNLAGCSNESSMPSEMPDDFQFSLKYGVQALNEIDTFNHTYTKDLIMDGTITTDLELTKDNLQAIYQGMKEIEIVDTVKNAKYEGPFGEEVHVEPLGEYQLKLQLNGEKHNLSWTENIYDEDTRNELAEFVYRFLHEGIIMKKEEYKALPQASGGYE